MPIAYLKLRLEAALKQCDALRIDFPRHAPVVCVIPSALARAISDAG
jgi:hypothetical protein